MWASIKHIPVTIGGNNIVNLQLLSDFLDAQMQSVGVELFSSHGRIDGRGQTHQTGSLVFARVSPSVSLLALSRGIRAYSTNVSGEFAKRGRLDILRSGLRPRFSSERPSAGAEGL